MTKDEHPVVITRTFDAPVEKVWHAWRSPDVLRKWWGPAGFTAPVVQMDFIVGGKYLFCMRGSPADGAPEQDFYSTGTYKVIVPKEQLVMSDSFSDENGNVVPASHYAMPGDWPMQLRITVDLEEKNSPPSHPPAPKATDGRGKASDGQGKTKMTLTHEGIPEDQKKPCIEGWSQSFDKLADILKAKE